jgi:hydroxymethylpyrimidine pyrophosphatase-like HAD family hydrolase
MYKHFFFDVDNTLTRSRSEISREMIELLDKLRKSK